MKKTISIFGAGYVGTVTGAILAESGHAVTMLDVSEPKLQAIGRGQTPVAEPGLSDLLAHVVRSGCLKVSQNAEEAVRSSEISIVCVGTPSLDSGAVDLQQIEKVSSEIGRALRTRQSEHVVIIRSTILPGTIDSLIRPTIEQQSRKRDGLEFQLVFNPEFLREGTALEDYKQPPKIVIGSENKQAIQIVSELYRGIKAPHFVVSPEVAEIVKYTDNTWHALKVSFGNEIARICHAAGGDSHAVMNIFVQDVQLNISPTYLRPGFAFGGSCLPKDLRALIHYARHHDVAIPLIENILRSNEMQVETAFRRVIRTGSSNVGMYGLSFKPGTDDLRESPLVLLAERLIGRGVSLRIFDQNIQPGKLTGSNLVYLEQHLPHFIKLLVGDVRELESCSDLVILGHTTKEACRWLQEKTTDVQVLDLVRVTEDVANRNYSGLSW